MNDCSKCCFFRSDAWCYRKLRYVRPDSQACMQFIGGVTSEEIEELTATVARISSCAVSFSDGSVTTPTVEPLKETKKPDNGPKCFSCGKRLYIERRGRDGYCAECGCYIPQIMYDKRFAEADKTINPMTIPRPVPLPTAKCRG